MNPWGAVRLTVLADPHGNLPALEAVIQAQKHHRTDRIVCAGDLVGYYPWPNEVLELLRSRNADCIRGNHDRGVLGLAEIGWFNENAAVALEWTMARLTAESKDYLWSIENRRRFRAGERLVAVYHGSPSDDDEYVLPEQLSSGLLVAAKADILILGHSHLPMMGKFREGLVLNPGSVGQPRDGDPRASYAVLDTAKLTAVIHRVGYDIEAVVERVAKERLPARLGERLRAGR